MSAPLSDPTRIVPPRRITRRRLLASMPAFGGLLLAGCSRELAPPVIRGGLVGAADVLTMSTNRWLLADQPLAREYLPSDIAPEFPTWGQTNPPDEEYQRLRQDGFRDWRLPVSGLVGSPASFSLDDLRGMPARTQITAHVCEQGWSAIAQWTGVPLLTVLEAAGGVQAEARYAVFNTADGWYESIDMFDVVHPQTILAYGLNGGDLPVGNGAPLRLRVERQCGYKNLKFLKSIRVVDSMAGFGQGTGGINSDWGFHWYAGV
jgi:DMSO/TMAO reductase YedYZ molybdopterin-dependent catalytic subunit